MRAAVMYGADDVRQVAEQVWLVAFILYDLGFFDDETGQVERPDNPFEEKVLPMCPEPQMISMVRPAGFEPATLPLGGGCSIP